MSCPHTIEELTDILLRAITALENGQASHITRGRNDPWHLAKDLERLDACCPEFEIKDQDDYWNTIYDCLKEAIKSPLQTYKRPEKPICSHQEALDHEMFAFVVKLDDFTRPIYTKFCLKELSDGTWYISIGCHT